MAEDNIEQQLDDLRDQNTLDSVARQAANVYSSLGRELAKDQPGLIDKLVNPKYISDSPYHGIMPNLNFGNFSDDPTGVLSDLQAEILFLLMDMANNYWVEDWLVKKHGAIWTVNIEETKGRGPERLSKLFFSHEVGVTMKKERLKGAMEK